MQMTGYKEKQRIEASQHFFAASVHTWAATTPERNLPELLALMEKEGRTFNLFLVPVPWDSQYDINFFQPQVKGTQWLGTFDMKKGV